MSNPQWKYEEYSAWAQQLAKRYTTDDLEKKLGAVENARGRLREAHHRAVKATTSMSSMSQRRAHSRNAMVTNYEERMAIKNALEIHFYYPQYARESN